MRTATKLPVGSIEYVQPLGEGRITRIVKRPVGGRQIASVLFHLPTSGDCIGHEGKSVTGVYCSNPTVKCHWTQVANMARWLRDMFGFVTVVGVSFFDDQGRDDGRESFAGGLYSTDDGNLVAVTVGTYSYSPALSWNDYEGEDARQVSDEVHLRQYPNSAYSRGLLDQKPTVCA